MIDITAKTEFAAGLAELTGVPLAFVRQRNRLLYLAGVGPRRNQPLGYRTMADYVIAHLAAPTHLEAAETVKKFGAFRLVGIAGYPNAANAISTLLHPEKKPLREVLADLIEARAAESGPPIVDLRASWSPYDEFQIRVLTGGATPPTTLTFADEPRVAKRLRATTTWYLRHDISMDGSVIDVLAPLGTPETTTDEGSQL